MGSSPYPASPLQREYFSREEELHEPHRASGQCKACRLAASDTWSQFLVGALPHNGQALIGVEGSLGDALLSIPQFQLPAEPQ